MVHATNKCSFLEFQFLSTLAECQTISMEFSSRSKVGFTNCIGCINGLLIWLKNHQKNAMKLVLTAENVSADKRESLVSTFKEFVMPDDGLYIFQSNTQLLHLIIWLLSLLLYMVVSQMMTQDYQMVQVLSLWRQCLCQ